MKRSWDMYNHLGRIPACDRLTDRRTGGQTDRQTDTLPRHRPRYEYASCGKNYNLSVAHTKKFVLGLHKRQHKQTSKAQNKRCKFKTVRDSHNTNALPEMKNM